jgi:hypothetical protein
MFLDISAGYCFLKKSSMLNLSQERANLHRKFLFLVLNFCENRKTDK